MHNPIAFAVPVFLVAMAIEVGVARAKGRSVVRFDDALGDLSCGLTSQGIGIFLKLLTLPLYAFVFARAPWPLATNGVATWILGVVGYDFFYYWWHRKSHEWNALWAIHVVHHQSDDFNLAVALRQDWLGPITSTFFGLPLALLGVPPVVYLSSVAISLLYQFWIHTELIGKLGAFEKVFNTPSHHRVHHGTNTQYLDKNYGGILIVWDRLFGTLEIEDEQPAYGVTTQFTSFDALQANVAHWREIGRLQRARSSWLGKLRVLVEPPGYDPTVGRVVPGIFDPDRPKYRSGDLSTGAYVYLVSTFLAAVGLLLWMLWNEATLPLPQLALGVAVVLVLSLSWSARLESRPRALSLGYGAAALSLAVSLFAWRLL